MCAVEGSTSPNSRSARPVALLLEPSPAMLACAGPLLAEVGFEVCILDGVPEDLSPPAFVLVEADRGSRTVSLARQVRCHWPEIALAGVLPWWDDDERDLARVVDLIVHVPVREDQLKALRTLAATFAANHAAGHTLALLTS